MAYNGEQGYGPLSSYVNTYNRENALFFIVVVEITFPRYAGLCKCQEEEEQGQQDNILL
jgi:hypothetical protein